MSNAEHCPRCRAEWPVVQDGRCGACGWSSSLIGMLGQEAPPPPPEKKLDKIMLPEIGNSVLDLVRDMGVPEAAVVIIVCDANTGEVSSTSNVVGEDFTNMVSFVLQKHLEGRYDEETHEEVTKQ